MNRAPSQRLKRELGLGGATTMGLGSTMGYSAFDGHDRPAWNAGRKIGSKRALKQKEVWAIRFSLDQEAASAIARSSTWQSTASQEDATWSAFAPEDLVTGDAIRSGQRGNSTT